MSQKGGYNKNPLRFAFTDVNDVKNVVFWDATPCSQIRTAISDHPAAYEAYSDVGNSVLLHVDTRLPDR
jgi:hypothetical protein